MRAPPLCVHARAGIRAAAHARPHSYSSARPAPPSGVPCAAVIQRKEHVASRTPLYTEEFEPLRDGPMREVVELLGLGQLDELRQLQADVAHAEGAAAGASLAHDLQGWLRGMVEGPEQQASLDVYVPTGAHQLLTALCRACPEAHFTLADFSWLPPQPDGAVLAPVVQSQQGGNTIDLQGNYLRHPGRADILFPTHFGQTARLVDAAARTCGRDGLASHHASTAAFMRRWHDVDATATRSGFNPLLDDFVNTRVLSTGDDGTG